MSWAFERKKLKPNWRYYCGSLKAAVKKQLLDGRKAFSAYKFWQSITAKDNDRLKLSQASVGKLRAGTIISRGLRSLGYHLIRVPAYRSVLEWAFHQKLQALSTVDVAAHWHEHHRDACGTGADATLTAQAISFLYLSQGAEAAKALHRSSAGQQTLVWSRTGTLCNTSLKAVRARLHG